MHRNDDYMRRALMTLPPTGDEAMAEIAVTLYKRLFVRSQYVEDYLGPFVSRRDG